MWIFKKSWKEQIRIIPTFFQSAAKNLKNTLHLHESI